MHTKKACSGMDAHTRTHTHTHMAQGDPYEVAAKCQAAAEAFDALEEWLRLPDASQDEIQAAVLDFRQAQALAAQVGALSVGALLVMGWRASVL